MVNIAGGHGQKMSKNDSRVLTKYFFSLPLEKTNGQ